MAMNLRDFGLLFAICLIWAGSNVLSKVVVGDWQIPPLYFAAVLAKVVSLPVFSA